MTSPPASPDESVDDVFAALADPTRRSLLAALADDGEATATTLAATLPISRQAVVKHLMTLEQAGLVTSRHSGREKRFTVRTDRLDATARWLEQRSAQWGARLAMIKRIAES